MRSSPIAKTLVDLLGKGTTPFCATADDHMGCPVGAHTHDVTRTPE